MLVVTTYDDYTLEFDLENQQVRFVGKETPIKRISNDWTPYEEIAGEMEPGQNIFIIFGKGRDEWSDQVATYGDGTEDDRVRGVAMSLKYVAEIEAMN